MQPCQNYSWPPRAGRYQQTGGFLPLFHTFDQIGTFCCKEWIVVLSTMYEDREPGASETYGVFNDDDDSRCI